MTKFIQCEQCNIEIRERAGEKCEFAVYPRVIDGKKHVFCCERCAEHYEKRKRE